MLAFAGRAQRPQSAARPPRREGCGFAWATSGNGGEEQAFTIARAWDQWLSSWPGCNVCSVAESNLQDSAILGLQDSYYIDFLVFSDNGKV